MPRVADLSPLQDVAEEFGVDRSTIYRYLRLGKLKRWKREMDQRTYIDRDELRRLLEFRQVGGE